MHPPQAPRTVATGNMAAVTVMYAQQIGINQIGAGGCGAVPAGGILALARLCPENGIFRFLPNAFQRFLHDRADHMLFHQNGAVIDLAGIGMP